MTERIVSDPTPPTSEDPQQVVLKLEEWREIEDSLIAFHAALRCGAAQGGEEAELLQAVYDRFAAAIDIVRERIYGD